MANKIQIRRGTKAQLTTLGPLAVGEPGLCTDTKEVFVGSDTGNIGLADWIALENTEALVYYVDAASGNDLNSGLAKAAAFKTIAKAVTMIRGVTLTRFSIILAAGSYNEDVKIEYKLHCQTIELKGETTDASLYKVRSILINNLTNRVGLANIEITTTTAVRISVVYCNRTLIENVIIRGVAATQHGASSYDGNARVVSCQIFNRNIAIVADGRWTQ